MPSDGLTPPKEPSMSPHNSPQQQLSSRQVSTAAENIAAAQFSLYGFDVLEQASRTRFVYDLGVAKSGGMMKVMVHASLDGIWDLVEPYLERSPRVQPRKADCHRAIDLWLEHQSRRIACCLVKFESADLRQMPRIYLASAAEIAEKLHEITNHLGASSLCEEYEVTDSYGGRRVESLPSKWRFSQARIAELMRSPEGEKPLRFGFSAAVPCSECAESQPAACLNCGPMMN
jgi:hypothetical protein